MLKVNGKEMRRADGREEVDFGTRAMGDVVVIRGFTVSDFPRVFLRAGLITNLSPPLKPRRHVAPA